LEAFLEDEVEYGQFSARLDVRKIALLDDLAKGGGRSRNKQLEFMIDMYVRQHMPDTYQLGDRILVDGAGNPVLDEAQLRSASRNLGGDFGGVMRAQGGRQSDRAAFISMFHRLNQSLTLIAEATGLDPKELLVFNDAELAELAGADDQTP
jgi:hypothetical protein